MSNLSRYAQDCARMLEERVCLINESPIPRLNKILAMGVFATFHPICFSLGIAITLAEYTYCLVMTDGSEERLAKRYAREIYHRLKHAISIPAIIQHQLTFKYYMHLHTAE